MTFTIYSDTELSLEDKRALYNICEKYQIKRIALSKDDFEVFNLAIEESAPVIGNWGMFTELPQGID